MRGKEKRTGGNDQPERGSGPQLPGVFRTGTTVISFLGARPVPRTEGWLAAQAWPSRSPSLLQGASWTLQALRWEGSREDKWRQWTVNQIAAIPCSKCGTDVWVHGVFRKETLRTKLRSKADLARITL